MKFRYSYLVWLIVFGFAGRILVAQAAGQSEAERLAEMAQKAMAEGQFAEARTDFEQLEKLAPGIAEVHATLAVIHFKLREYESTISEARAAQRLNANLPRLNSLVGLSLAEMGQLAEALPLLGKGFKYAAEPEVRRMCGLQLLRAYTGLGRDAEAVTTSLELNKLYPEDPEVLYHTGRVIGNYGNATMERLHTRAPNSIWTLQAQGEASESQRDYDAALMAFTHVLKLDPERQGIHYRLGRVHLARYEQLHKTEDHDAAQREFLAELTVDPGNGNASYELGQLSAEDNDLEGARRQFEALVARFPDFEQALVGLGGVYLRSGMADKAMVSLTRATKLEPADEVAWFRLAQAERSTGNREAAQRATDRFHALHASGNSASNAPPAGDLTPQRLGPGTQPE